MNIYVGNLSYNTSESAIQELFERFGNVDKVSVITDRYTGKSRGFAFVEMSDGGSAAKAIEGLNGVSIEERSLVVHEARPRTESSQSSNRRRF